MQTLIGTERSVTTRLHAGDVIELGGRRWRVLLVNECRAFVQAVQATRRTVTPRFGKPYQVSVSEYLSISPNSECEIV